MKFDPCSRRKSTGQTLVELRGNHGKNYLDESISFWQKQRESDPQALHWKPCALPAELHLAGFGDHFFNLD